jgi:hypothetical protein
LFACAVGGYWWGRTERRPWSALELSQVSSAAAGSNMAVATGQVSDEAEGVFFLDFLTGDLQCLVYYPRQGAFGARYYTNVQAQIPGSGKDAQYLMVTGNAVSSRTSSNLKPANCLVYITDVNSGMFAAYTVPWSKTAESSSQAQGGPLLFVGGGPIRNYKVPDAPKKGNAPLGKAAANNNFNNLNNNLNNNPNNLPAANNNNNNGQAANPGARLGADAGAAVDPAAPADPGVKPGFKANKRDKNNRP